MYYLQLNQPDHISCISESHLSLCAWDSCMFSLFSVTDWYDWYQIVFSYTELPLF